MILGADSSFSVPYSLSINNIGTVIDSFVFKNGVLIPRKGGAIRID